MNDEDREVIAQRGLLSADELAKVKGCTAATVRRNCKQVYWVQAYIHSIGTYVDKAYYEASQQWTPRRSKQKEAAKVDILAAVFAVNRYAKRCRDAAQACYLKGSHSFAGNWKQKKQEACDLKGQALHYALGEGLLQVSDKLHRFPAGNYAEVLVGGGYRFHRPCKAPEVSPSDADVELNDIEAKPRETAEPRLKDALHTLRSYLKDKPRANLFEWPRRQRYFDPEIDMCSSYEELQNEL